MNKLRYWLLCAITGRKGLGTQKVTFADGFVDEIVLFHDEKILLAGQCVPFFNDIMYNTACDLRFSNDVKRYILEHEYGHKRENWFLHIISALVMISSGLFFLTSSMASVPVFIYVLLGKLSILDFMSVLFWVFLSLFIFSGTSWFSEWAAEWRAIRALGVPLAKKVQAELLAKRKKSKARIYYVLTHPPLKWVIRAYEKWT